MTLLNLSPLIFVLLSLFPFISLVMGGTVYLADLKKEFLEFFSGKTLHFCAIQHSLFNGSGVINSVSYLTYCLHFTQQGQLKHREFRALLFTNGVWVL